MARVTRQDPLPGVGGGTRFGRRAAVGSKTPPAAVPGDLPLRFRTIVDPADVLLHISIAGEPRPKERPQFSARLFGTGMVVEGKITSGNLRIVRNVFTPRRTEETEEAYRWIFRNHRTRSTPTAGPVGVLALFRTTGSRADADNLFKLVGDAMNGTIVDDDQQITEIHAHILRRAVKPGTDLLAYQLHRR